MTYIPYFNAEVKTSLDGQLRLSFTNMKAIGIYLRSMGNKPLEVSIRPKKRLRSVAENSYFHGVIVPMIAEETGYSLEDTKTLLKLKFCPKKPIFDENVPRGTSTLSTSEFENFCSECRTWAAEFLNLNIPLPGEVDNNIN